MFPELIRLFLGQGGSMRALASIRSLGNRIHHSYRVCVLGAVVVAGCTGSASENPGARERRWESLALLVDSSLADVPETDDPGASQGVRLTLGPAEYRIGEAPTRDVEEFGRIRSAIILEDGSLVVADDARHRLVLVAPGATDIQAFGRKGEGPGEFVEPSQLLISERGSIEVLDNGMRRLSELRSSSEGLQLIDTRRFSVSASGVGILPQPMCRMTSRYIALGYDAVAAKPLHEINPDASHRRSFGLPFVRGSNRLNDAVTQGRLLCLPDLGMVVLVTMLGDLIGYAVDGTISWRRRIEGFRPIEITAHRYSVGFNYVPEPDGVTTRLGSLNRLSDSLALLQFRVMRASLATGRYTWELLGIDSRIVSLITGAEVGRQADLPIVLAVHRGRVVVTSDDPEPWVELRRFSVAALEPSR